MLILSWFGIINSKKQLFNICLVSSFSTSNNLICPSLSEKYPRQNAQKLNHSFTLRKQCNIFDNMFNEYFLIKKIWLHFYVDIYQNARICNTFSPCKRCVFFSCFSFFSNSELTLCWYQILLDLSQTKQRDKKHTTKNRFFIFSVYARARMERCKSHSASQLIVPKVHLKINIKSGALLRKKI